MNQNSDENEKIAFDFEKHWNNAYQKSPITNLGWYEENPLPSLELIEACNLPKEALIFNAGAGATTLIGELMAKGYKNIVVNDISSAALKELENHLPDYKNAHIQFLVDDLTNPSELLKLKNVDLWHDRAVLHFFTEQDQQKTYFNLLKKVVKPKGFVILAEFNLEGAKKCNGLNVFNYNKEMLQDCLGADFELLKAFDYTYIQPSGNTRAYVYTLFQRKS
ncbi:MAG: methyltransferase domain-containing protein [Lutibacter sp.]